MEQAPEARRLASCVVAAFNSERWVSDAIRSILDQTYRPIEVIVVDDGSQDATSEVARGFGEPVRVITQETAGPAATRNRGVREARGDYVAWLDADDLWHPEKLVRQVTYLEHRPAIQGVASHVRNFWAEGHEAEEEHYRDHLRMNPIPGWATTTLLVRRPAFVAVGELDTELWFGDALDWFMRARDNGIAIEMLSDVLTFHRLRRDNLSTRRSRESEEEFLDIVKTSLERRRAG
jgi:glycosyltransferase involved in cell wall biosynthesis